MKREDLWNYNYIPENMMISIKGYIEHGNSIGHFLTAVLSNDLSGAVNRADEINLPLIPLYVRWFHNYAPSTCYGSLEKIRLWYKKFEE